jgi:hypothetical protein
MNEEKDFDQLLDTYDYLRLLAKLKYDKAIITLISY